MFPSTAIHTTSSVHHDCHNCWRELRSISSHIPRHTERADLKDMLSFPHVCCSILHSSSGSLFGSSCILCHLRKVAHRACLNVEQPCRLKKFNLGRSCGQCAKEPKSGWFFGQNQASQLPFFEVLQNNDVERLFLVFPWDGVTDAQKESLTICTNLFSSSHSVPYC